MSFFPSPLGVIALGTATMESRGGLMMMTGLILILTFAVSHLLVHWALHREYRKVTMPLQSFSGT